MSTLRPGTLVMLKCHPSGRHLNEPLQGAIGEIQDHSGKTEWYIEKNCSVVSFPNNKSVHPTGYWQHANKNLMPISGPDIDVGEEDVVKMVDKKPVEDLV